jgi:hypothetical protein
MNTDFTRHALALAGLALLVPAHAQQDRAPEPALEAATQEAREAWRAASRAELERQFAVGEAFEATLGVAGEMAPQRVVKGAPYCADAVHETVQWLADGSGGAPNRIVRQQNTRLCRDGEGRTRQEVERGNRRLVYLHDPVARESWVLTPSARPRAAWAVAARRWPSTPRPGATTPSACASGRASSPNRTGARRVAVPRRPHPPPRRRRPHPPPRWPQPRRRRRPW